MKGRALLDPAFSLHLPAEPVDVLRKPGFGSTAPFRRRLLRSRSCGLRAITRRMRRCPSRGRLLEVEGAGHMTLAVLPPFVARVAEEVNSI